MQITIDTSKPLSQKEHRLLSVLLDGAVTADIVQEPAPAPAPVKKAAPKPAPTPEPEPEPEPEEDLLGTTPTVQDAVDAATAFVQAGKQAKVKAALKSVGGDRVSNIPQSKVAAFLAALEG